MARSCFLQIRTKEFVTFVTELRALAEVMTGVPQATVVKTGPLVSEEHKRLLVASITYEVRSDLFSIHPRKGPGPDGYATGFYQPQWEVVGDDVWRAMRYCVEQQVVSTALRATVIHQIPKGFYAKSPADYRPISCCNIIYKIIWKVLAGWMQLVLPSIINPAQATFVTGRLIEDNVCLAQENTQGILEEV